MLLIGGGTSSCDIAKELKGTAKAIYQSTRNGIFDHPITVLPAGVRRVSEIASFNLEQECESRSDDTPISGTVTLVNGQVLTNIDRVIVCTGYHITFPFLSEYHRDSVPVCEADRTTLVTDGTQMHNLHKDIFYIPDPTLAFIGVPYYSATFSLFEFQAITVAAVFSGKAHLPEEEDARSEYDRRVEQKGLGRSFHNLRGKDVDYVDELLAWINPGIVAAGGEPVEGHSEEWKAQYEILRAKSRAMTEMQPKPGVEKPNVEVLSRAIVSVEG